MLQAFGFLLPLNTVSTLLTGVTKASDSTEPKLRVPLDWHLPAAITRRLGERSGRQRTMSAEGHVLLILHAPPLPGDSHRVGRLFWRDPKGSWRSTSHGLGAQALLAHVAEFAARVDGLEEDLESADSAEDYYALLRAVAPLHRSARNLQATLQQARELVPDDSDLINARDQAGEIERALELLHSDAAHGLDFTIAKHAEQQAEASYEMSLAGYRLNLLAATFFPLATIGAIFGMNLTHGFESANFRGLFWFLLAIGLMAGVVLAKIIARKPQRTDGGAVKRRVPPKSSPSESIGLRPPQYR